jgi:hypothetical protein
VHQAHSDAPDLRDHPERNFPKSLCCARQPAACSPPHFFFASFGASPPSFLRHCMNFFLLVMLCIAAFLVAKAYCQRQRLTLLAGHLVQFRIEQLMETVTSGYLRALGEADTARRGQIFSLLEGSETALSGQFNRFAEEFGKVDGGLTRVSTLAVALPWGERLVPQASFDLREAFRIHARGIADTARNEAGRSSRDKAFQMSAELFLMQHSCHWFCRSKSVASARLQLRHGTSYAQVLAAVSPQTRAAFAKLVPN